MQSREDLLRGLAELCDLDFQGSSLYRVRKFFKIDPSLVSDWMEHIFGLEAALVRTEDEIDPMMEVLTDICGL